MLIFLLTLSLILLAIAAGIAVITVTSLIVFGIVKVPYVQTPKKGVEKMFQLAQIKPDEKVFDLGCGNGNFVFKAEKEFKAQACGFELSPWPYFLARLRKIKNNYHSKIYFKDFLEQDLSEADVIFCFLMPGACSRLSQKLAQTKFINNPRIISYGFAVPNLKNFTLIKQIYNKNTPIYYYENNES